MSLYDPEVSPTQELYSKLLNSLKEQKEAAGRSEKGRHLALAFTHLEDSSMRYLAAAEEDK